MPTVLKGIINYLTLVLQVEYTENDSKKVSFHIIINKCHLFRYKLKLEK